MSHRGFCCQSRCRKPGRGAPLMSSGVSGGATRPTDRGLVNHEAHCLVSRNPRYRSRGQPRADASDIEPGCRCSRRFDGGHDARPRGAERDACRAGALAPPLASSALGPPPLRLGARLLARSLGAPSLPPGLSLRAVIVRTEQVPFDRTTGMLVACSGFSFESLIHAFDASATRSHLRRSGSGFSLESLIHAFDASATRFHLRRSGTPESATAGPWQ